jgi:hypothetical protein
MRTCRRGAAGATLLHSVDIAMHGSGVLLDAVRFLIDGFQMLHFKPLLQRLALLA